MTNGISMGRLCSCIGCFRRARVNPAKKLHRFANNVSFDLLCSVVGCVGFMYPSAWGVVRNIRLDSIR